MALRQNLEHDAHHSHPGRSGNSRRCPHQAGSALAAGFRQKRHAGDPPPRGRLCRAVLDRLRPAGLDRLGGGDPRPAVRGVRAVPPRYGSAHAQRQARPPRPVETEDQDGQGNRPCDFQKAHRPRRRRHDGGRPGACGADRAARHRSLDRRHLSLVLPRQRRRLAGGRSRLAGGGASRLRPEAAARRQGDGEARREMAAVARGGRASVVGLLSCGETARGRAGASDMAGRDEKAKSQRNKAKKQNGAANGR